MGQIGVLALQGGFAKHLEALSSIDIRGLEFRELSELPKLSGLIIPGGESTTIGMLLERRGLLEPLQRAIKDGLPVFGTCAGAILLANTIVNSDQVRIGGLDIEIDRNAYGRQVDSFEIDIEINDPKRNKLGSMAGVFIRAPKILTTGTRVSILSTFADSPILVQAGNLLAATFHPELTSSTLIHDYFARTICAI